MKTTILLLLPALLCPLAAGVPVCSAPSGGCVYGSFDSANCVCVCTGQSGGGNGYCADHVTGQCTLLKSLNPSTLQYYCPSVASSSSAASSTAATKTSSVTTASKSATTTASKSATTTPSKSTTMTPSKSTTTTTTTTTPTPTNVCVDYLEPPFLTPSALSIIYDPTEDPSHTANVTVTPVTSTFGSFALNVHSSNVGYAFKIKYNLPASVNNLSSSSGFRLSFYMKGDGPRDPSYDGGYTLWQINTPQVTLTDTAGHSNIYIPLNTYMNSYVVGEKYTRYEINLKPGSTIDPAFNYGALASIAWSWDVFGWGFDVTLDGLIFDDKTNPCALTPSCPPNSLWFASTYNCECLLGYTGPNCSSCATDYVLSNGKCVLANDGNFTYWPNPVSGANSDSWLMAHHADIQVITRNILVLNFANPTDPVLSKTYYNNKYNNMTILLNNIVANYEKASQFQWFQNPKNPPNLKHNLNIVNLFDGMYGTSPVPNTTFENSGLTPRFYTDPTHPTWSNFDYSALYNSTYASYYGYSDGNGGYYDLCTLVDKGLVHEVWTILSGDVTNDAYSRESAQWVQKYSPTGNKIPGAFSPCAGNGCFEPPVAWFPTCASTGRSLRFVGINPFRGPSFHGFGHNLEELGSRRNYIPSFSDWFVDFAGLNLDLRYNVDFESTYGQAKWFTNTTTATLQMGYDYINNVATGPNYTIGNFDPVCGTVHFAINSHGDYQYHNTEFFQSSCVQFGKTPVVPLPTYAWQTTWSTLPDTTFDDNGGDWLQWWMSNMPWYPSNMKTASGKPMLSPGPFFHY
ncbi:uncharacterized protein BJ171DRAFT_585145 [Polychytrium aggregatum]|uniref:uncharacterized protein n=1 Tax=Polychytrium aggregatum TaxID=110093 RepID=UPI0022FF004B|nr:uncharacterized protein BJ171DRAFT_585145 [Polychytrium aggregatum]KAI9199594.1 hypothetical protein BJ171DRAFT_585145 [Polychytrium aggregatum]